MKHSPLFFATAVVIAGSLLAVSNTAFAQGYRIQGDVPGIHAASRLPPTASPLIGLFRHWDLREFPNCTIPWSMNAANTADTAGAAAIDRAAFTAAFTSWQGVVPAIIAFNNRPDVVAATVVANDGQSVLMWDGGVAAHLAFWGGAPSGTLAVTCIWTNAGNAVIQESDIVFNDRDWQWNHGAQALKFSAGAAAPYAVTNGQTLIVSVDGGAAQTVTFAGIAVAGAATPIEIAQNIVNQIVGVWVFTGTGGAPPASFDSQTTNGTGTVQVTGGTAAAALAFPGVVTTTRLVDVETVAVHEIGHFVGLHHSVTAGPPGGPVMIVDAPINVLKRALTAEDKQALNFMYTPDLGDAPDPTYQSLVHTAIASRMLNGVQLFAPDDGPVHLFGHQGPSAFVADQYEWLGAAMDGSADECESLQVNLDLFDDGMTVPAGPIKRFSPGLNVVKIEISHTALAGRYVLPPLPPVLPGPGQLMYMNGYFDFVCAGTFGPGNRVFWWQGTNAVTIAASANLSTVAFLPNKVVLEFIIAVPAGGCEVFWSRIRLDYNEDEGVVNNFSGDLGRAVGSAQFGEVEDYPCMIQCPCDFNEDGSVNAADLAVILGAWGTASPFVDLNGDGVVNASDLAILLGLWGPCPGP